MMEKKQSLSTLAKEIGCQRIRANSMGSGWQLYCKLDKKPAGAERCRICRRKK